MVHQPDSAFPKETSRVVVTGPSTTAIVSQNFLRASARSKTSLTHIDSLRASYPLKLLSPSSANTAAAPHSLYLDHDGSEHKEHGDGQEQQLCQLPPPPRIVYMITYGGGLLADDHPDLKLVLTRHARLLVLGQGNTKIYKSPTPDHPPASQTLHSTVGPGAVLLFLGPAVVACEDSSVFLRHEILLQAQRRVGESRGSHPLKNLEQQQQEEEEEELPNCVVLDWIAGGRGEEERWKARRSEWRLIVRWAELDPESPVPSGSPSSGGTGDQPTEESKAKVNGEHQEQDDDDEEEEFEDEEDPRDVADRLAGGPVIFRDGFLIEHNPPLPTPTAAPTSQETPLKPKMTSYAPSLYPHATIGSLFVMGPKTERLQRSIMKRFEKITIYPGQKSEQRADYPILWSATAIQVPRPHSPSPSTSESSSAPRRKRTMMKATVIKMASEGIEQMQDFLKSLFEEYEAGQDDNNHMMDEDDEDDDEGSSKKSRQPLAEKGLSVIDELFGGRTVWERAFR